MSTNISYSALIPFPIAGDDLSLGIRTSAQGLTAIDFLSYEKSIPPRDAIAEEAVKQIQQYFVNPSHRFTLALDMRGTSFQQRVWSALCDIPAGTTDAYGVLAKRLTSAAQAVGQACRRNPIPLVVPCHRVVSLQGAGGYAGATEGPLMTIKRSLLAHEGVVV